MNLSDYVLKFLLKKKVKKVFLITGGAISFMVDAFSRNKKINYISVGHEQGAAMMADAYATSLMVLGYEDGMKLAEAQSFPVYLLLEESGGRLEERYNDQMRKYMRPIRD